ncbi:MAG: class I SAM-dependent methyltransferase [Nanoarchaeota archaeon]|nr:class I SAM-dependent methyltransferase [Nanoarchaeota archaeon]
MKNLILDYIPFIIIGIIYFPLLALIILTHIIDYRILKTIHVKKNKWSLNICCGNTDGGGMNADVVKRNVPNFKQIKNVYKLPFKNKEFKKVLCSHTMEHLEKPDEFYKELKRVGENVTILIPPIWDLLGWLAFREHKWQFLTPKTKHENKLPKKIKLPYWKIQKKLGQEIRC